MEMGDSTGWRGSRKGSKGVRKTDLGEQKKEKISTWEYREWKTETAMEPFFDNTRGSSLLFKARDGMLRTKVNRAKCEETKLHARHVWGSLKWQPFDFRMQETLHSISR